jgi:2-methylcitrate dehydratase PrpD
MTRGNDLAAEFILTTQYDRLPGEVIQQAKRCLLDMIAVTLAGTLTRSGAVARDLVCEMGGTPEATVAGLESKVPVAAAVFANTTLASSLDFDDGYRLVKGHPGAFVIPAALALAERDRRSGKDFIAAAVTGYEIGIRAGIITHASYHHYHSSGSWGGIGTFAAIAQVLGLDRKQILNGLGIAEFHGAIAPALRHAESPSMLKGAAGWGAYSGAWAALLAKKGYTGIPSLFGFEEHQDIVRSLGREFRIRDVYFKPYTCCRWAQPSIDGTLKILAANPVDTRSISKILVRTFSEASKLSMRRPETSEQAQYSIPYVIACAIADGEVGPRQVCEDRLTDPATLSISDKVQIDLEPAAQSRFPQQCLARVLIETECGTYDSGLMGARGDPDQPLSDDELKKKFVSATRGVISESQGLALLKKVECLEAIMDMGEIARALRATREGT